MQPRWQSQNTLCQPGVSTAAFCSPRPTAPQGKRPSCWKDTAEARLWPEQSLPSWPCKGRAGGILQPCREQSPAGKWFRLQAWGQPGTEPCSPWPMAATPLCPTAAAPTPAQHSPVSTNQTLHPAGGKASPAPVPASGNHCFRMERSGAVAGPWQSPVRAPGPSSRAGAAGNSTARHKEGHIPRDVPWDVPQSLLLSSVPFTVPEQSRD